MSLKRKWYRIYYNRAQDAPQIWSVDEGTLASEINVQQILVMAKLKTASDLTAPEGQPKAWLEGYAHLTFHNGTAILS